MRGTGFLAIWSDVTSEQETDYFHWLTREHTTERLSVDGFLRVRVFRAVRDDICRYFIHYELRDPQVLSSNAYLARLNAPTPWSQRIMPILRNFARGGGRVVLRAGLGEGCLVAPVGFETPADMPPPTLVDLVVRRDRVIAAELAETDLDQTVIPTREKGLRERDTAFSGLLLVEALDEPSVSAALASLALPQSLDVYRQVFSLATHQQSATEPSPSAEMGPR